jgi:hypothetical protein
MNHKNTKIQQHNKIQEQTWNARSVKQIYKVAVE